MTQELVVISGKGGTGKTSIVAAFSYLAENKALCDADVDASDLHLIMNPTIKEKYDFQGGLSAKIDFNYCIECGICNLLCQWQAINSDYVVDPVECEGCGVCAYFCPERAIEMSTKTSGEYYISDTRFGPFVHAKLGIAEENSGKLVTLIRKEVRKIAESQSLKLIITDGPPGIGCPVIASIGGASAILIVTEPTISGIHDMKRLIELTKHFKVPTMLCINKYDINLEKTKLIEQIAINNDIDILGKIPFDSMFSKSMIEGKTIFEYNNESYLALSIKHIWGKITSKLDQLNVKVLA